jgi:hypothetical protein
MPWFMSKDGKERIWFSEMPEPAEIAGVKFTGGDYACVEDCNKLHRLTEEEYLERIKTLKPCDWL